jgi:GTP-binding protein HflX
LADPKRSELSVRNRKAVLAAMRLHREDLGEIDPLEELRGLTDTAHVEVVGTLIQNRHHADHATLFGKGKVEELKALVEATNAELVVFDNNLAPAQMRNLEEAIGKPIVDRSELILTIFAEHARTHESQLQVELAQLLYMRPRLRRLWSHLERTEGAVGSRGPGEQQLETDRRLIDDRVTELRRRLADVEVRRERMVLQRKDHVTVSLVGYTNAGKSTLMNALTDAGTYVADQLFATLDTRTRTWSIPNWGDVLLSDTVGFIRDLPHHLVSSFRSTLEEARHADLLLHTVDASHPAAVQHVATVNEVLAELGIDASKAILVLNKIDRVEDRSNINLLRAKHSRVVAISAKTGLGLDQLAAAVSAELSTGYVNVELNAAAGNGRLLSFLATHAHVTERKYVENRVEIRCRIPRRFLHMIPKSDVTMRTSDVAVAAEGGHGNGANPGAHSGANPEAESEGSVFDIDRNGIGAAALRNTGHADG